MRFTKRSETEGSLQYVIQYVTPKRVNDLVLCVVFFMIGLTLPSPEYDTSSSRKTSTRSGNLVNTKTCSERLDELDAISDEKRRTRQEFATNPAYMTDLYSRCDLWEPEAVCFSEERFGETREYDTLDKTRRYQSFGDGPKFVCGVDLLAAEAKAGKNCLVYNVGSHNEIEYELSVNQYIGCEVHTFDPTVDPAVYKGHDYSVFHPWGIGLDGQSINVKLYDTEYSWVNKGLENIYEELGHKGRKIDMLKIDCEGCEWDTMPIIFDRIASGELEIDQIQIELHPHLPHIDVEFKEIIAAFFAHADKAGMRIVHKERNQWGCDGWKCLEYVFVSEKFLRRANAAVLGCPLDS